MGLIFRVKIQNQVKYLGVEQIAEMLKSGAINTTTQVFSLAEQRWVHYGEYQLLTDMISEGSVMQVSREKQQTDLVYICPECGEANWSCNSGCKKCGVTLTVNNDVVAVEEKPLKHLLVTCGSCAHSFSKRAEACPKCGWKRKLECQICLQNIPYDSASCPECGDPDPFNINNDAQTKKPLVIERSAPKHTMKTKDYIYHSESVDRGTFRNERTNQTSITKKVISTIVAIFFGTIIFGVIRDFFGHGQYIISGVLVFVLIIVWKASSVSNDTIEQ